MTSQIPLSNISTQNVLPKDTHGYPELAKVMGAYRGMSIYLRFADLNARDLLVYQAEILQLEQQLEVYDQIVPWSKTNILKPLTEQRTDMEQEHWNAQMGLRSKLKDYNETLLRQAKIQELQQPSPYDLNILTRWLEHEKGGNNFLNGFEDLPWTEERSSDLIALSKRDQDHLTTWTAENLVPWFFRRGITSRQPLPGQEELGLTHHSDTTYTKTSRLISILTSSLIPSLAILILYFIHNLLARIFVAMGLSFLFSVALALLTQARAAEIFASTAA
ncbi:hypothetical protein M438DRAFT_330217 [Aureobasidium pullulans EXF-150]|uniref:DUF6594 domain-containing protein n=1 Tax=Aureobasidium pullulans EXF-150 TaxID=1043002 RepID=A0A074Y4U8_AURPU|nr:uncharacterized protein M438DRAFT_330217 [Aureobasidium pullulans EXF-150]KEQ89197.1 hypothetical protein M438DRAFT_330217 [Aureobasidium pullulans EXF-150]